MEVSGVRVVDLTQNFRTRVMLMKYLIKSKYYVSEDC
jgi:hypothetical protein